MLASHSSYSSLPQTGTLTMLSPKFLQLILTDGSGLTMKQFQPLRTSNIIFCTKSTKNGCHAQTAGLCIRTEWTTGGFWKKKKKKPPSEELESTDDKSYQLQLKGASCNQLNAGVQLKLSCSLPGQHSSEYYMVVRLKPCRTNTMAVLEAGLGDQQRTLYWYVSNVHCGFSTLLLFTTQLSHL